jgi:hypothetical protein
MWWIRLKADKKVLVINHREGKGCVTGKYLLGYKDKGRAITALRVSGIMTKMGLRFRDLELVNQASKTFDEMVTWPIQEGFALRHKKDLTYWIHPQSKKVWYSKPDRVESAWRINESVEAAAQSRTPSAGPAAQGYQMVRGNADKSIEILVNWLA